MRGIAIDDVEIPTPRLPPQNSTVLTLGRGPARAWGSCACACERAGERRGRSCLLDQVFTSLHLQHRCTALQRNKVLKF